MLQGAILYPGMPDDAFINSLHAIRSVKWEDIIFTDIRKFFGVTEVHFSSDCSLICIMDPGYTSFSFLAGLVRKGCHLFLPEKQMMSADERVKLMRLAEEGNSSIQIRNDLLFHPVFLANGHSESSAKLVEIHQVAPGKTDSMQEFLYHNVLMALRIVDSEPSRISVCSIPNSGFKPDMVNIHLNFHNGSAASLTLSFNGKKKEHLLSVHDSTGLTNFNFTENNQRATSFHCGLNNERSSGNQILIKQIAFFADCILKKGFDRIGLNKEESTYRLIEKINQKLAYSEIWV